MKIDKITIILIIIFILIIVGIGFLFNYFLRETKIPELKEETKIKPEVGILKEVLETTTETKKLATEKEEIATKTEAKEEKKEEKKEVYRVFYKNPILTFKIYKDKLYFYDLKEKTLSYYSFQNDLVIPIYKNEKVVDVIWGPNDNLFLFKTWQDNKISFLILDVLEDSVYNLSNDIREINFLDKNFVAHIKTENQDYLALLDKKGKILKKIKDVSFEEIKIVPVDKSSFLVFELPSNKVSSYIWIYNTNGFSKILTNESTGVFALPVSLNQVLVNKIENTIETKIIDLKGKTIKILPEVLAIEKCTNYSDLVCAIGPEIDLDSWYFYKTAAENDEIFIYSSKKNDFTTFKLEKSFDILYPQILDKKIYFIDKNSWDLYEYEISF